jgi:hypothetical protein
MPRSQPADAPAGSAAHTHLVFPGAGIYFFWQAGVVKALQEGYDLGRHNLAVSGASAGSISCVLAMCSVDMDRALELAVRLADDAGVFTRPQGLAGIWGHMIEDWLDTLLPDDCYLTCSGKVNISVTSLTATLVPLHRHVVNTFYSKKDLIDACLTSVYIPFFIDGHFCHTYRGEHYVDGSLLFFLHNTAWCASEALGESSGAHVFNHCDDHKLMQHHWGFLRALDRQSVAEMFALGHEYGTRWANQQQQQAHAAHSARCHGI